MAYPRWWDTTITVYNKFTDPITSLITWHRTVINGCFIKAANNKVTVGQTVLETNNIIIRIPEQPNYKEYGEWVQLPNDQMSGYFTLHQGAIIVKGEVSDTINEYTTSIRSSDILNKYKEYGTCLVVSTWQDNTGRPQPHYFVSGE